MFWGERARQPDKRSPTAGGAQNYRRVSGSKEAIHWGKMCHLLVPMKDCLRKHMPPPPPRFGLPEGQGRGWWEPHEAPGSSSLWPCGMERLDDDSESICQKASFVCKEFHFLNTLSHGIQAWYFVVNLPASHFCQNSRSKQLPRSTVLRKRKNNICFHIAFSAILWQMKRTKKSLIAEYNTSRSVNYTLAIKSFWDFFRQTVVRSREDFFSICLKFSPLKSNIITLITFIRISYFSLKRNWLKLLLDR